MPRLTTIAFTIAGGLAASAIFAVLNGNADGKVREWEYRLGNWLNGRSGREGPAGG